MAGGMPSGFGFAPPGPPQGKYEYAGFWRRFVAIMLDALLVGAFFTWPIRFYSNESSPSWVWIIAVIAAVFYFAAWFVYFILLTGYKGQTLGKTVMRLKVFNLDMTDVSYATAATREFSKILSAIICYVGFFMAGFDDRKQALHDKIAKTYVIKY